MLETVLAIPFWFELAATMAGAVSGAMSASRAKCDIFGTVIIACLVGLIGGVIRDVLLQDYGIYAFQNPSLIIACVVVALVFFYFGRLFDYLDPLIYFIDSLAVGMWAIISAGKALSAGLGIVPAVVLGTITAVGGGIVRDVLLNKPVAAFQAGPLYGSAALFGSLLFAVLKYFHIGDIWSPYVCVALVVALRYLSDFLGWRTKPSRDLTSDVADAVVKPVRSITKGKRPPTKVLDTEKLPDQAHIPTRSYNKRKND